MLLHSNTTTSTVALLKTNTALLHPRAFHPPGTPNGIPKTTATSSSTARRARELGNSLEVVEYRLSRITTGTIAEEEVDIPLGPREGDTVVVDSRITMETTAEEVVDIPPGHREEGTVVNRHRKRRKRAAMDLCTAPWVPRVVCLLERC
jgi:hypothetical protein